MNDRRRALLFDGGQALVWGVLGFVFATPGEIRPVWWLVGATAILSALAVGLSAGVLGYRVVYGVVRPVPERRLERARGRGV